MGNFKRDALFHVLLEKLNRSAIEQFRCSMWWIWRQGTQNYWTDIALTATNGIGSQLIWRLVELWWHLITQKKKIQYRTHGAILMTIVVWHVQNPHQHSELILTGEKKSTKFSLKPLLKVQIGIWFQAALWADSKYFWIHKFLLATLNFLIFSIKLYPGIHRFSLRFQDHKRSTGLCFSMAQRLTWRLPVFPSTARMSVQESGGGFLCGFFIVYRPCVCVEFLWVLQPPSTF